MADRTPTHANGQPRVAGHQWTGSVAAGRSVAVVGDVGDGLVLALRRSGASRLEFLPPEALAPEAPSAELSADFDVVLLAVYPDGDRLELEAARSMLRPDGCLALVVHSAPDAPAGDGPADGSSAELDALAGRLERSEARRAAILDELLECERALTRTQEFAEGVHTEILLMRRTVSWRVTWPLRWVRARAARR